MDKHLVEVVLALDLVRDPVDGHWHESRSFRITQRWVRHRGRWRRDRRNALFLFLGLGLSSCGLSSGPIILDTLLLVLFGSFSDLRKIVVLRLRVLVSNTLSLVYLRDNVGLLVDVHAELSKVKVIRI